VAVQTDDIGALQASWDGHGFSLWAIEGEQVANHLALRALTSVVFGYHGLAHVRQEVTPLYLPAASEPEGGDPAGRRATHTQTLRSFEGNDFLVLRRFTDLEGVSPSIRWACAAVEVATAAVRAGLLAPSLAPVPLPEHLHAPHLVRARWEARWKLRSTPELDRAIDRLDRDAPSALWAPFPGGPPVAAARSVVEHLADGAARWALDDAGWRAELGRSSRADKVVARRFVGGLREDPVVVAANDAAVAAAAALAAALDQRRAWSDAGVRFRCRARLRPPEAQDLGGETGPTEAPDSNAPGSSAPDSSHPDVSDEHQQPWRATFEVVLLDDPSVVIAWPDLAAGRFDADNAATGFPVTTAGGVTVTEAGLAAMATYTQTIGLALADQIPEFADLAIDRGEVSLSVEEVAALLVDGADRCDELGCTLLVPKELARRKVRVSGTATARPEGGVSANLGQTLVDVDWALALGDHRLTEAEVVKLAEAKSDLVQLRGAWVRVDAGQAANALRQLQQRQGQSALSPAALLRLAAETEAANLDASSGHSPETNGDGAAVELLWEDSTVTEDRSADNWLTELLAGLPDDRLREADEPPGFVGQLRPYQRRAVGWLSFLFRLGLGGCLADDMGLGKTPTTLAHLLAHRGQRPSLVICPLSVVHNWEAEAARFAPELTVFVAHGSDRERGEAFAARVAEVDLVITTYGTLSRDVDTMAAEAWNIVVCDEAQAIKNHRTKAARAVRALQAAQLVALTGTPVENRLSELWSILDAANPGSLGGVGWFRDTFATPIETRGDEGALAGMKRLTGPFVLRRTKADKSLVPDLPDKVEQVAWAQLTEEQAGLYKAVLDDFLAQLEKTDADPGRADRVGSDRVDMQRRGLVVATLTRLKQICNHPAHYLAAGGEEPGALRGRSGKLNRFDELVSELLEAGERALVFTQYREMGELLVAHVADVHDVDANFLHGGVSRTRREKMVTEFQSGSSAPLQIVSLKAGGTGLNLTAASRVIHYDRWWNPAVEDQATDRAWRIGQTSTVFVHKLVCRGTLEERIDGLLEDKRALADSVVGSGEGWLTEMSTDELRGMFRLGSVGDEFPEPVPAAGRSGSEVGP
jgi:hypothetical protein